ncbi:MAG: ferrous iron transport protein A [Thermoprotei archaeon]|nr:MAG: ferrous iron transport protein A [Thermoprotei archaeon]RLE97762.1 MAG: ferrous iron transport protein A [Thermoprotei archaeon]HDI75484.1 ferrous iron transport protein A [Thermoprotei archaeon]
MIPLAYLPPGTRARIVGLTGGYGQTRRLMEMGFTPGTQVEVLSSGPGPLLVKVRGVVVALGRGVASKIIVEPMR